MSEQDLDRSEAATPHKLSEARKRGQVAKSADLVSAVVCCAAAAAFSARGWDGVTRLFTLDRQLLGNGLQSAQQVRDPMVLWGVASQVLSSGLAMLAPWLALIAAAAILANIGQTGPVWSWHPIKPDWLVCKLTPAGRALFDIRH